MADRSFTVMKKRNNCFQPLNHCEMDENSCNNAKKMVILKIEREFLISNNNEEIETPNIKFLNMKETD